VAGEAVTAATNIQYVGDPFVDAGVAVLEYRLDKACSDFSESDLVVQKEKLKDEYGRRCWRGYLTVHFPNSGWCNATMGEAAKATFLEEVLGGYGLEPVRPRRACAYCGRPAQVLADRSYVPLLTSKTNMVAGPGGAPGLPVCGYWVYAIQFYPLATLKVDGRPLFWWASDPRWTWLLNRQFLESVQKVVAASSEQFGNLNWPATQLMRCASRVVEEWKDAEVSNRPPLCDLIGCHVTNYGPKPTYDELRIPRGPLCQDQ